jgi:hypothetical protein
MKEINEDKFIAWLPFDVLEKSEGDDSKKEMIIGGIASNDRIGKDKEGEKILVDGMDCTPFLSSGYLNYHHQASKDPSAIIGEPISVEKKEGKLHIKGKLYSESQKARDVYSLGQILQKSGSNRKLGFSIEGKALERDPNDPGIVTRSVIYGCAITPSPINDGTSMQIIKGELDKVQFESEDGYFIRVKDSNGVEWSLDKNFNIIKAMEAGSITGRDTTGQNLTQEPLKVEDVEGKKKKKDYKKLLKQLRKRRGDSQVLSKGEIICSILNIFKTNEIDVIKGIYELVTEINMTPTAEDIQKAKELLGLVKGKTEEKSDLEKAKEAEDLKKAEEEKEKKKKEEKVADLKKEYKDNVSKGKEYMEKAEAAKAELKSAGLSEEEIQGGKVEQVTPKEGISKAQETDLIKAFDEKFEAFKTVIASKDSENAELKKSIEALTAKVEEIGKQSPGAKSLISKSFQQRFPEVKDGERVMSLRNHKRELTAELVKAAKIGEKDQDDVLAKAASYMEIAGTIGATPFEVANVAQRIKERLKIQLIA